MIRSATPAERSAWRAARGWLYGFAGLCAVLVLVGAAKNWAVRRAILRINALGGLVTSDEPYLPARVHRILPYRWMTRVQRIFVLREGYDVSFGWVPPHSFIGEMLRMAPAGLVPSADPGDVGLLALRDLPRIKSLQLMDTSVNDEQLRLVRALEGLTELNLGKTPIDGSGLPHLRGLRRLRVLSLTETRIDDDALDTLDDLPALEDLGLGNTRVRGVGLSRLSRFPALKTIYLQGSLVDDHAMDELEKLPGIHEVFLCQTRVTRGRLLQAIARRGWTTDVGRYCK